MLNKTRQKKARQVKTGRRKKNRNKTVSARYLKIKKKYKWQKKRNNKLKV